jgi:hypothetical protein
MEFQGRFGVANQKSSRVASFCPSTVGRSEVIADRQSVRTKTVIQHGNTDTWSRLRHERNNAADTSTGWSGARQTGGEASVPYGV